MTVDEFYKIIDDIIIAKKMREPKKPVRVLNTDRYVCDTCGGDVSALPGIELAKNLGVSYCAYCGQAIDWRDSFIKI